MSGLKNVSFFSNRSVAVTIFRLLPVLPIFAFSLRTTVASHCCRCAGVSSSSMNGLHNNGPIAAMRASARAIADNRALLRASDNLFFNSSALARNSSSLSVEGSSSDSPFAEHSSSSSLSIPGIDPTTSPSTTLTTMGPGSAVPFDSFSFSLSFFAARRCCCLALASCLCFFCASILSFASAIPSFLADWRAFIADSIIISSIRPRVIIVLPHASRGDFPVIHVTGLSLTSVMLIIPSSKSSDPGGRSKISGSGYVASSFAPSSYNIRILYFFFGFFVVFVLFFIFRPTTLVTLPP
mmetsp:Transcript_37322/g.55844  ORF Transcript_37322/g.55844 Transcript_37322/m.55844 type:complete len:296 (+) Transcript_37322:690-1577(+)